MNPLRVAVVGAGWYSPNHLLGWQALASQQRCQLAAVVDIDPARAAQRAAEYGDASTLHGSNAAALIEQSQPDWLDLVLPPSAQAPLLELALSAGLPVVCQKPFGRNLSEARRWTERFEAAGLPLVIHENFRFAPWFRAMKQAINAGQLGRLHGLHLRLRPGDGQGPDAYLSRQPYFQSMPRLLIAETGVHAIDLTRHLLGPIQAVQARLRRLNPAIQGEDAAWLHMDCGAAGDGVFDGNRLNDHPSLDPRHTLCEAWLEGSAGVMRLDGRGQLHWLAHGERHERPWSHEQTLLSGAFGGASAALCAHVAAHALDGAALQNTAREYLHVLHAQEAAYASHNQGRRIELADFEPPAQPELPHFN